MDQNERKEIIYWAMKDLYKEYNYAVNNLIIIREFLNDLLNVENGNEPVYDYPSVERNVSRKNEF